MGDFLDLESGRGNKSSGSFLSLEKQYLNRRKVSAADIDYGAEFLPAVEAFKQAVDEPVELPNVRVNAADALVHQDQTTSVDHLLKAIGFARAQNVNAYSKLTGNNVDKTGDLLPDFHSQSDVEDFNKRQSINLVRPPFDTVAESLKEGDDTSGFLSSVGKQTVGQFAKTGIGAMRAAADAARLEWLSEFLGGAYDRAAEFATPRMELVDSEFMNDARRHGANVLSNIATMAPSAVIGGVPGLGLMGFQTGANKYGELRSAGIEPLPAAANATAQGMIEALTEGFGGTQKLAGALKKGGWGKLAEEAANVAKKEVPSEWLATGGQYPLDAIAGLVNPSASDFLQAEKDTTIDAALQAGLMSAPNVIRSARTGNHVRHAIPTDHVNLPEQLDPVTSGPGSSLVREFGDRLRTAMQSQRDRTGELLTKLVRPEKGESGQIEEKPVHSHDVPSGTPVDVLITNGGVNTSFLTDDLGWHVDRVSGLPDGLVTDKGMSVQQATKALERAGFHVPVDDVLDSASRPREPMGDFAKLEEEILREQQAARETAKAADDVAAGDEPVKEEPESQMSLFSLPENPRLMALHNLTGDNLAYADKMGGFAVPSLGVVTDQAGDVQGFGDISLIGRKPLADPAREPVYSSDAYTARYPQAEWSKVRSKEALRLTESIEDIASEFDDHSLKYATYENMVNRPDAENVINTWLQSDAAKAKFLREEKGIDVKPVMGDINVRTGRKDVDLSKTRQVVEKNIKPFKPEYKTWVRGKILPYFSEPHLKVRGKKVPYTLPNIVNSMLANKGKGREKTLTFGTGQTRAATAHEFSDLEEMRGYAKERIVDHDQYQTEREQTEKWLNDYRNAVIDYSRQDTWTALDSSMKALAKWLGRKKQDVAALKSALRSEGFDVAAMPDEVIQKAMQAGQALRDTPVPYFEAKPQRAVALSEFAGAVIPKNTSAEVREILKKHGIEAIEYEGDRTQAVRDFAARLNREGKETLFQKGRNSGSDVGTIRKAIENDPVNRIATVVQSVKDLPDSLRHEAERAGSDVEGIYHPKEGVYLIADNLTPDRAVNVARHEVIGHYGFEQMLGTELMNEGISKVREGLQNGNKIIVELSDEVKRRQPGLDEMAHAKEVVALMAERNLHDGGFVRRMLDAIRRFLHKIGLVSKDVSDADIAAMLRDARNTLAKQARAESTHETSRVTDESELNRQFDEVVRQYKDTPQWMKAPNGEPTKLSEREWVLVRTPHFRDWFGDWETDARRVEGLREALRGEGSIDPGIDRESVTSDSGLQRRQNDNENTGQPVRQATSSSEYDRAASVREENVRRLGALNLLDPDTLEPRVFYHGTKDTFTEFDLDHPNKKDAGWLGKGIYLSGDDFIANEYSRQKRGEGGAHTMHLFASMDNPFIISLDEKNRLNIHTSEQAAAYADSLKEQGYDGVIAYNFNFPDFYDSPEVVVFSPERVKSATNNVGTFSPDNPDIRYSRSDRDDSSQLRRDEITVREPNQIKSATDNIGTFSDDDSILFSRNNGTDINETQNDKSAFKYDIPAPTLFDNILRENQDKNIDVKRVQDAIRKAGGFISDDQDAYTREGHYLGRVKEQLDQLQEAWVNPIIQTVSDAGVSITEAGDWLYARHVVNDNVNAWLAKINNTDHPALSGMSDDEAKRILSLHENNKHMKKLGALVDGILNDSRERMVASGLETRETIEAWKKRYASYVPLIRDDEGTRQESVLQEKLKEWFGESKRGSGFDVKGPESQQRLGDEKRASNILGNVIAQAQGTVIRAEKARVAKSLYDLAQAFPNDEFWQIDKPARNRRLNPDTGLVEFYYDMPEKANTLAVKINGIEHWITFNKKNKRAMEIARSYKSLDAAQLPWLVRGIGDLTRYLSKWITTNNPVFALNNFRRDIQHALFNMSDTSISGKEAQVLKNIYPAMRGYWQAAREKQYNNREANFAREFREAGGETGFVKSFSSINDRMADLEKQLKELNQSSFDPRKWAQTTVNVLEEFNSIVENGVRLSVYMVARENGSTVQQAADIAKNITVDFNRKGRSSGWYNALYMFANANIQGHARTLAAIAHSKKARIMAAGLVGLGALMDVVGRAVMGDDDETGKKVWDEIEDFEKERNWIIPIGGRKYLKIALPQGLHVLPNLGRMLSELAFSSRKQDVLEKTTRFYFLTVDAFNPFGSAGSFSQWISPSVTKPIVQIAENKGFTGSKLRRDDAPFGGLNEPAYTKAYRGTPNYWTAMSRFLNDYSGGDDVTPGRINIAPETLRLAATSYILPGTSAQIDRAINAFSKSVQGQKVTARDFPAVSQVYGEAPDERAQEREYYDMVANWKQKVLQAKRYQKEGRREDMKRTLSDLGDGSVREGLRRAKLFDRYEKGMAELNKERKRLEDILKKNPERKLAETRLEMVQERRKRLIREFLNRADQ